MAIALVFYAGFGYLALLGAILWGMLFVGGGITSPNIDGPAPAAPLTAACIDVGLLLLLALLHRSLSRGMLRRFARCWVPRSLERSTQAWAAAAVLVLIYRFWQPLPQVLWSAPGSLKWAFAGLFYLAWTLIMIGAFLASHLDLFDIAEAAGAASRPAADGGGHARIAGRPSWADTLRQPLYSGILLAVWATAVMTLGHLLLAAAVTVYLLIDGIWAVHMTHSARESRGALSFQRQRIAG